MANKQNKNKKRRPAAEGGEARSTLVKRPPIVVIMGHIDHGKTTLLDHIRKTNVAGGEAGGITQSIGAYEIEHKGEKITFIDTPGHEAFSRMRSHGAKVADLAVLVVGADDGVKPQTKDALKHILEAGIPYVVAINKIDLPSADIEKTKQDLSKAGVFLEGQGGNISFQLISAKKGDGIDDLLDLINLAAEVEDLTYDPDAPASGVVLTSFKDPRRGVAVGVVIKNGTLKRDDEVYAESAKGKVKLLENFLGVPAEKLEPSAPALILGFNLAPNIGEVFLVGEKPTIKSKASPAEKVSEVKEKSLIKLVLKASESGSLEALEDTIKKISAKLPLTVIESTIGNIHEGDVKHAFSTGSIVIGFHTKIDKAADNIAKAQKVKIMTSSVIYDLEKELEKYADKIYEKEKRAIEILAVFGKEENKSNDDASDRQIIGGKVTEGHVNNLESFEIIRDEKKIGAGKIVNLQSGRKDVERAEKDQEVGLLVEANTKISEGCRLIFSDQ